MNPPEVLVLQSLAEFLMPLFLPGIRLAFLVYESVSGA